MALIKCSECGRDVSNKAATCPGCGAPIAGADTHPLPANQASQMSSLSAGAPSAMQIAQANPSSGGMGFMILGIILFIWAGLLLLETLNLISTKQPAIILARLVFATLLFIWGIRAWKSGRKRRTSAVQR